MMDDLLIARLVLVLVGLLPTGVVLLKMRSSRRLLSSGIKTKAVVRQVNGSSHSSLNSVDIEYTIQSGARVAKRLRVAGLPYKVGQKLPLIYDPTNPHQMMLGWKNNYTLILIFTGLIAVAILVFAILLNDV